MNEVTVFLALILSAIGTHPVQISLSLVQDISVLQSIPFEHENQ
jgi:hypothetical protein